MAEHGDSDDLSLRFSLTLPGSASLGAYQAGAMSAFAATVVSLREQGHDVHVDAVGGSSAGSIVATLGVHCLATGRDATNMLRQAWVEDVDIDVLRATGSDAPLHVDDLRDDLVEFLGDTDKHPLRVHEPLDSDVVLEVGLTSLRGLRRDTEIDGREISTLDYADWTRHVVPTGGDHTDITEARPPSQLSVLDSILASASHPIAFTPQVLDRSDDEEFGDRDATDSIERQSLWYTDGGLVESEPVGRIVRAARTAHDGSGRRIHLVIDPRASGPSGDAEWSDPDDPKSWLDGLRRAISIVPTQALHDDLREVAAVNTGLDRLDEAVDWCRQEFGLDADRIPDVRDRLAYIADLGGKERVHLELITPLVEVDNDSIGDGDGVNDMLAGDFAGAFGGFLSRRLRRSDYALGWRSFQGWVEKDGLAHHGVDADSVSIVLDALTDQRPVDVENAILDGPEDGVAHLDLKGRLRLTALAGRFARVAVAQATPSPPRPLDGDDT